MRQQEQSDLSNDSASDYPIIPDRLYFTISEAAELCLVRPHVLRYWEKQFVDLSPVKRKGRRYFSSQDVLYIRQIRELLYVENFTIEGAKAQLSSSAEQQQRKDQVLNDLVKIAISRLESVVSVLSVSDV